jgi:membrane dipeptidase
MRLPILLGLWLMAPVAVHSQTEDAAMVHARKFLASRPILDGHNDLPWEMRMNPAGPMDVAKYPLRTRAPGQTDFARMKIGGLGGQFWSVYVPGEAKDSGYARMQLEEIDIARRMIAMYPDQWQLALSADDFLAARKAGKVASYIGMEGGHAIENSLGALRMYYALGARYMTLTHNVTLDWADAAQDSAKHGGLTDFGRDVVREMNRLGMVVDLSHVSPGTMSDVLDVTAAPVMFSHSSARALADVPRNVPDSILARMPKNGGVVMVTFVSGFISTRGMREWQQMARDSLRGITDSVARNAAREEFVKRHPRPNATVADVANHIEHVRKIASIDNVGLGGDYDGTTELPTGMEDVTGYPLLFAELIRRGWTDAELTKLANGNMLRVLRGVEQTRDRLAAGR